MPALLNGFVTSAVSLIRTAEKPLSFNEMYRQLPKESRVPEKTKAEAVAALREVIKAGHIFPWPNAGNQRDLFWGRSFFSCVRDGISRVLEAAPMTITQVSRALKKHVPKTSESKLRDEAKAQLRILTASAEVIQIGIHYCGIAYLKAQVGNQGRGFSLTALVLDAVQQVESGPGNYVSLPNLRKAPAFHRAIQQAIIELAKDGKVVLAGFDAVPSEEMKLDLIEGTGRFYIGIAREIEGLS